ncbi:hypothetical protein SVIOM342S_07852 [Streptomyces violaceorubidus]
MNGATPPHSIGELSARTGVSVRTIRFYSDTGLLPPPTAPRPATAVMARRPSTGSTSSASCGSWTSI